MFTVTHVGSWPRSRAILAAMRDRRAERMTRAEFDGLADDEVRRVVRMEEEAGVEVLTDGEIRRDNFYSFVTDKLDGTTLMSLAEMLDTTEDRSGFAEMLDTLDVPASAIRNPTCTGRLARREPLAAGELAFTKSITGRPVKVTLPGPYLLTRSMWVGPFTAPHYEDKYALADDVVRILREELADLSAAGADFVQFDEPVLTEVALSPEEGRRTFM